MEPIQKKIWKSNHNEINIKGLKRKYIRKTLEKGPKKSYLGKPISATGTTMRVGANVFRYKKKNIKAMLGFLKKQKIILVNLIIYKKNSKLITCEKTK